MTTVYIHNATQKCVFLMKGALESVMSCSQMCILNDKSPATLGEDTKHVYSTSMRNIAQTGMRVIALAVKVVDMNLCETTTSVDIKDRKKHEDGFFLLGLVGLQDPPRPESAPSVAKAKEAGILLIL